MDIESSHWSDWESRFMALAEAATAVENKGHLGDASSHLCLYGDNGLSELEELHELGQFETKAVHTPLQKVLVDTSYWQDIVLYYT